MAGILDMLLSGQSRQKPELTHSDMAQYVARNPEYRDQFLASIMNPASRYPQPAPQGMRDNQAFGEAAAVGDFGAATALQRLLGMNIDPRVLLNESHGLARRESYRYR